MSSYEPIRTFKVGDTKNQVFLVADTEARTTKKGKPFARLILKDASGQITTNVWDFDLKDNLELKAGVFIMLTIEVDEYQGTKNASARSAPMIVNAPEDVSLYESQSGLSPAQAQSYYNRLMEFKGQVKNPFIQAYLDVIFDNPETEAKFKIAPASVTNRGAYRGGLVEHTYKVMLNAEALIRTQREAQNPPPIDTDIVFAGVLTHDLGKIHAYVIDTTGPKFTRSGLLLDHLPMSYAISIQSFMYAEDVIHQPIPEEIKDHINHCILAHHGLLEYGSPVKPRSLEAQIVHMADMADSTTSQYAEPTRDNLDQRDEQGFVPGTWTSSKLLFVGDKQPSE